MSEGEKGESLSEHLKRLKGWKKELALARAVNVSNVFLVEVSDRIIIDDLVHHGEAGVLLRKPGDEYPYPALKLIDFNVQAGTVAWLEPIVGGGAGGAVKYRVEKEEPVDALLERGDSPISLLIREALVREPTVLVIRDIATEDHVDTNLIDRLLYAAHHPKLFKPYNAEVQGWLQSSSILVITYSLSFFPEHILNQFVTVSVPPPDEEERRRVIEDLVRTVEKVYGTKVPVDPDAVIQSRGLYPKDIKDAAFKSIAQYGRVSSEEFVKKKIDMLSKLGFIFREPSYGFEAVAGYEPIKRWLYTNIIEPLKNPEIAERYGIGSVQGIVLAGPPGGGKTYIAEALAGEMGVPVLYVTPDSLFRGIVGETEARMRMLENIIDSFAPVVLVIDEAEGLLRARGAPVTDSGVSERVVSRFLQILGKRRGDVVAVMITNRPELMDEAFLRAGRADAVIPYPYPDKESREAILKYHMLKVLRPKVPVNIDFSMLAELTPGWSSADLAHLMRETALVARLAGADSIETSHAIEAYKRMGGPARASKAKAMLEDTIRRLESIPTAIVPSEMLSYVRKIIREIESQSGSVLVETYKESAASSLSAAILRGASEAGESGSGSSSRRRAAKAW